MAHADIYPMWISHAVNPMQILNVDAGPYRETESIIALHTMYVGISTIVTVLH